MPVDFTDARIDWADLDKLILSGSKLQFVARVREATDVDLTEALDALYRRYELLRESRPHEFAQAHDEYWDGFYS